MTAISAPMDPPSAANLPRIVVIGAGFGGLALVRGLAVSPAFVTVIDKTNHNLFQPLLYQVATAALAPSDIAVPVRGVFTDMKRVGTLMGNVDGHRHGPQGRAGRRSAGYSLRLPGSRDGLGLFLVRP